jgi:hypothetical protein
VTGRKLVLHHYRTRSVYNLVSKPSSRGTLEANTLDLFEMKSRISLDEVREAQLSCRDCRNFKPCCPRPVLITEQSGVNCKITPINNNNNMNDQWIHQHLLSISYLKTGKQGAKATLSHQQDEQSNVSESESSDEEIWITKQLSTPTVLVVPTANLAVTVTELKTTTSPVSAEPQPTRSPPKQQSAVPTVLTVPTDKTRDGTYYTQRKVPELPKTQNPPRDRRSPQKYSWSLFEINCTPIDTELSQPIKTKIENFNKEETFKEHHSNQKPRQPPYASTIGFWQAYYVLLHADALDTTLRYIMRH